MTKDVTNSPCISGNFFPSFLVAILFAVSSVSGLWLSPALVPCWIKAAEAKALLM